MPFAPADRQHPAQLPAPHHRHAQRRLHGLLIDDLVLVVVADDGLARCQAAARQTHAGFDAGAVPVFGDAVAGGGDGALVGVADVDAAEIGLERERGLVHERQQDLLQVERRVERAAGADDGAVLHGARGAPFLGLEAGEAGRGEVRGELRAGDHRRGDVVRLAPAGDRHRADLVPPARLSEGVSAD